MKRTKHMNRIGLAAIFAICAALVCGNALAASDTQNLTVSATVAARAKLSLSVGTINFADADPDDTPSITNVDIAGQIVSGSVGRMETVRVAVCQLDSRMGRVDGNVTLALTVAQRAVAAGADYLLFHENMVHEYPPNAAEVAEPVPGPVTDRFTAFCARHGVGVGFGMTMRGEPRPYNGAVFLNARGEIAATYAKRSLVRRIGYEEYMAGLQKQLDAVDARIDALLQATLPEKDTIETGEPGCGEAAKEGK